MRQSLRWMCLALLAVLLNVLLRVLLKPRDADEARAIQRAKQAVAANDTWANRAAYRAERTPDGWAVSVDRKEGLFGLSRVPGDDRLVLIDRKGKVVRYIRGY